MSGFGVAMFFVAIVAIVVTRLPVYAVLLGTGAAFAALGVAIGAFPWAILGALPDRIVGLLEHDLLQALPLYAFIGALLNRLPLATELHRAGERLFARSGAASSLSALGVGALLAPMNGSVGASLSMLSRRIAPALAARGIAPAETAATLLRREHARRRHPAVAGAAAPRRRHDARAHRGVEREPCDDPDHQHAGRRPRRHRAGGDGAGRRARDRRLARPRPRAGASEPGKSAPPCSRRSASRSSSPRCSVPSRSAAFTPSKRRQRGRWQLLAWGVAVAPARCRNHLARRARRCDDAVRLLLIGAPSSPRPASLSVLRAFCDRCAGRRRAGRAGTAAGCSLLGTVAARAPSPARSCSTPSR